MTSLDRASRFGVIEGWRGLAHFPTLAGWRAAGMHRMLGNVASVVHATRRGFNRISWTGANRS